LINNNFGVANKVEKLKALIIDEPWIGKILRGEKDWEMRSTRSHHRGLFGLIRKGSGQVVGLAHLSSVSGPHTNKELQEYISHHCVGSERFESPDYKWRYAWKLTQIRSLNIPVSYVHKSGAVIWVDLNRKAVDEITTQLNTDNNTPPQNIQVDQEMARLFSDQAVSEKSLQKADESIIHSSGDHDLGYIPQARDGSCFTADTKNMKGLYTVGDKGDERKFSSYPEALTFLKQMSVAKWRRINEKGNWGIVSAVEWVKA